MTTKELAKFDEAFEYIQDGADSVFKGLLILREMRQAEEEDYLARTDHICKCKECGKHDE